MLHKQIYALCDFSLLEKYNFSLKKYIGHISKYDIIYIQYRDKINSLQIQKQNLIFLKQNTNTPIIINDKLELLSFADGLHLGQEDTKNLIDKLKLKNKKNLINFLRKNYKKKIFGLSTHNELEILEANNLNLDYIGLGSFRDTTTKDISNILGDKISYLAKISKHKVGAIGGVKINDDIPNIDFNVVGSDIFKSL
jgi:thiamine-phosphate pyrophosphorylase